MNKELGIKIYEIDTKLEEFNKYCTYPINDKLLKQGKISRKN